jgi:hypothetical protein
MTTGRASLALLLWLTASLSPCSAFTSAAQASLSTGKLSPSSLKAGLFGGLFDEENNNNSGSPTTVLDISAKELKVGALRFFLQIYFVGECNKPVKGSWICRQNESGGIDMYYKDATGMCSIDMTEYAITVQRHGSRPSLQYQLQESVLLHGLLDELNTLAFEVDDIEEEKRLLRLYDNDALEIARETLPAKKV